jgi:hypothetical protein
MLDIMNPQKPGWVKYYAEEYKKKPKTGDAKTSASHAGDN